VVQPALAAALDQKEEAVKIAIVSVLVLALVSIVGVGYLAVRGIGAAAGYALSWAEPLVRDALPPGLAPERVKEQLDRAVTLAQEGRIDGGALRETVLWLPGALLDGQLDAAEIEVLAGKLDRMIAEPAPAAAP
jgi:hypothetical protein